MDHIFPHLNASLNAAATILLVAGWWLIKRRRERAHRAVMLTCFGVSCVFLASYLYFHLVVKQGASTRFPAYPPVGIRFFYYAVLLSHIVLAATVPFLALLAIWFGWRDQRSRHRRIVRFAWPIWLYVSVTGVVVYLMLYQLFPPQ